MCHKPSCKSKKKNTLNKIGLTEVAFAAGLLDCIVITLYSTVVAAVTGPAQNNLCMLRIKSFLLVQG